MRKIENLDALINSDDINRSIMQIDDFICQVFYSNEFNELSKPQFCFFTIQDLEREVNNGGFNQYFINTSGEYAHEVVFSLKEIGADITASLLQKAIDQFPNEMVPKDRGERTEIVEQIEGTANDVWDELDQKFFRYEDDLNTLNIEYVKSIRVFFDNHLRQKICSKFRLTKFGCTQQAVWQYGGATNICSPFCSLIGSGLGLDFYY